jgi:hypothetical protein
VALTFAWSWDGPSPLSGWSFTFSPTVGAGGRHGNAAFIGALSAPTRTAPAGSKYIGVAHKTQAFANGLIAFSGTGPFGLPTRVLLEHIGDGRLQVRVRIFDQETSTLVPGFVMRTGRWYFFEQYGEITFFSAVDNGDGTSTVTMQIDYAIRVNNTLLIASNASRIFVWPNPVPVPTLVDAGFGAPGGGLGAVIDDVYFDDAAFQGDGIGTWDGVSELYDPTAAVNPRMTQQLMEVGVLPESPNNALRMTQQLVEVGILPVAPNTKIRMTSQLVEVGRLVPTLGGTRPEYIRRRAMPGG